MKEYIAIYKHGHFINKVNGERVIPVQGEEYILKGKDDSFVKKDSKLLISDSLNTEEKQRWVDMTFGNNNYIKILNAGEQLFFRIGNSKRIKGDESGQYIFLCTLHEDLYVYLLKNRTGEKADDWRLAPCNCILDKCLLGGLTLSVKIPAESLNKLFSSTVMFYFNLQRSGSTNVFDTFFVYKKGMQITFDEAINKKYERLRVIRNTKVIKNIDFE